MTEIGRKRQHMAVRAVAVGGDGVFERAHGEAVTEIVEPRARLAESATKPDLACKLVNVPVAISGLIARLVERTNRCSLVPPQRCLIVKYWSRTSTVLR